jgi:1-acyl-sn-glycerol-3-phosphate acyltransferase
MLEDRPIKNLINKVKDITTQELKQKSRDLENVVHINHDIVDLVEPAISSLRLYHRHEVIGLENIPKRGKAIIAVNHSLATYDMALLIHAIFLHSGRIVRPLIDRLFFKFPYLGEFMNAVGCSAGNKKNAATLLKERQIILVAPGGMRESLRPHYEKYQFKWDKRKGFIQTAIEQQAPIILGACPSADDLYKVYPSKITKWMYQRLKLPVFFARGVGPTPIPRPIKLTHYLSEPIKPPRMSKDPEKRKAQIDRFHQKVIKRSEELMQEAINHQNKIRQQKSITK